MCLSLLCTMNSSVIRHGTDAVQRCDYALLPGIIGQLIILTIFSQTALYHNIFRSTLRFTQLTKYYQYATVLLCIADRQ